jgi:hypothetical protein
MKMMKSMIEDKKLEKVHIANTVFLVDHQAQALREQGNPFNKILFNQLKADPLQGGIPLVFDKLTRNLYKGYMPAQGLPPMTEQVVLRSKLPIDPQKLKSIANERVHGLDAQPDIDVPDRTKALTKRLYPEKRVRRKGKAMRH